MLVVDTGPLIAIADRTDPHHQACVDLLETDPGPLVTTGLVIADAGYLLDRNLGPAAEIALVDMITDRTLTVESLTAADWERVRELCATYSRSSPRGYSRTKESWTAPTPARKRW